MILSKGVEEGGIRGRHLGLIYGPTKSPLFNPLTPKPAEQLPKILITPLSARRHPHGTAECDQRMNSGHIILL